MPGKPAMPCPARTLAAGSGVRPDADGASRCATTPLHRRPANLLRLTGARLTRRSKAPVGRSAQLAVVMKVGIASSTKISMELISPAWRTRLPPGANPQRSVERSRRGRRPSGRRGAVGYCTYYTEGNSLDGLPPSVRGLRRAR
jgi:hypothetical protein